MVGNFKYNLVYDNKENLWLRGGFPRSYLAENEEASMLWRDNFIATFLERDIPQLGISIPVHTLRRLWMMLSNYNGQIINFSELFRSSGISDTTARNYIELLDGTFKISLTGICIKLNHIA